MLTAGALRVQGVGFRARGVWSLEVFRFEFEAFGL